MIRNFKVYIYILGFILLVPSLNVAAQNEPASGDTSGVFTYKTFLDHSIIQPFGKPVDKKHSTYSVSTVLAEDLRSFNNTSIGNTLAGKLTGLSVAQTGGAPGLTSASMYVRGVQSFVDPSIMVVVDGFQTDWSTILPDEVESIQVLKDAASLAVYGISAANGVVYIKTKRGIVRDRDKITFQSRVSFQQPANMPDFMNNGDYAELYNVAMVSDGKDIANGYFSSQDIVDYFKNGTYPVLYPDVNWRDEIIKQNAIAQDYNLSINGGKTGARYNVMLGFSNTPGLYDGLDGVNNSNWIYNRYLARINMDIQITEWLRSEVTTRGMMSTTKQPTIGQGTIWSNMAKFLPYNVTTPSGYWGGTEGYFDNPVAQIKQQGYNMMNNRTIDANLKLIADLPFLPGASIFGQIVFSNNYYSYYNKTRGYAYQELYPDPLTPGAIDTAIVKGDINLNYTYSQTSGEQWNRSNILGGVEYARTIGNGELYASMILQRELYTTSYVLSEVPWAKVNLFGRVNYVHDNKYIAEFGYSYSGTDNYSPGSRFGFFPSVSAAWIASNESFLSGSSLVNFLKLRGSFGMVGNDRIDDLRRFMFKEYYGSPSGAFRMGNTLSSNQGTFESTALANEDATWEKAYKANIGLDAVLFNDLSLSVDYFNEKRTDIFVDPANNLSVVIGGRYNYLNLGSAKNSGFETELMYKSSAGPVGYFLAGRFSYVKTEALDLGEPPRAYDYLYRKGNPINQPFVLEAIGFFADQADIDASPVQTYGAVKPGDVKYRDQNNDGFIDDNDLIAEGNPGYPGIIYSFDGGLEFKGFDISVFMQGVGKRTISLLSNSYMIPFLDERKPIQWIADNYWTTTRGNDALYPRLTTESNPNNYQASTLWQRDGSYFRIKNIELGYSFPGRINQKLNINGLRIYLNAVNILTIDKIDEIDIDPEINNPYTYPVMKSYNIGLTLNF